MTLDVLREEGWTESNPWPITHGHGVTVPGAPAAFLDTLDWFGSGQVNNMHCHKVNRDVIL